jgi:hypothetical protein
MLAGLALKVQTGTDTGVSVKVAATFCAAPMVTAQLPVPVQPPLQPVKVLPVAGLAVRITLVPPIKLALQLLPQSMPEPLTDPLPVPERVTVSV